MTHHEHIRLTMQIGMVFVILSFVQILSYVNIRDAAIAEPDSKIVRLLIFSGMWLWPLLISIIYVSFFPVAGRLSQFFSLQTMGEVLITLALSGVIAAFLTFSFLEVNKKIGLGIGRDDLLLKLFDQCLAKIQKSECHQVDLKKCITRESNYKETFDDTRSLYKQPQLLKRFQTGYSKYCPKSFWLP